MSESSEPPSTPPESSDSKEKRSSKRLGRISARTGKPIADSGTLRLAAMPAPNDDVFHAAERSAEFFDHLRAHYRKSRRAPVNIGAAIKILLMDGTLYDVGSATVLNVSPSGAMLGDVQLPRECYPVCAFKLEIVMKGGDYEGIGIEARPIRFEHEHAGLGVEFEEIFVSA
jgi:hypothetical protein